MEIIALKLNNHITDKILQYYIMAFAFLHTQILLEYDGLMPRSHLHAILFRKRHARRFSRERAGGRPRNSHTAPVTAT